VANHFLLSVKAVFYFIGYRLSLLLFASNMRGAFNGLESLIMRENSSAYYVHCFAHQLQLVVVAVARKHTGIAEFF